jgi:hypothetical protein
VSDASGPEQTEDTLALSYLDVISCGLGAAVLLFLVLSLVKAQSPALAVPTGKFVVTVFTLTPESGSAPYIRPNVRITPPGGEWAELALENRAEPAGRVGPADFPTDELRSRRFAALNAAVKDGIYLTGFAFRSDHRLQLVADGAPAKPLVFTVSLLKPTPGEWRIDLLANELDGAWSVRRQVFTSAGEVPEPDDKQQFTLSNPTVNGRLRTDFATVKVDEQ